MRAMSNIKTLYLFPDTNIFLQCKPLDQVDWSSFAEWDNIQIILTRPVQAEIDNFKGKGNGRQASRARTTSTLIRKLLDADHQGIALHASPTVRLHLRHDLRRDESVAEDLNYDERDDQLVGTAWAFQKAKPTEDIRLLTNDTGPMASAKSIGLRYHVVPEDWLLQPEAGEAEKREKALAAEIAKYKNAEPLFKISVEHDGPIVANISAYAPLTQDEVQELLDRLTERHPLATYFGPAEPKERTIDQGLPSALSAYRLLGATKEVFTPATPEQIEEYKEAYERWRETCLELFKELHIKLNSRLNWPKLTVWISNAGSRPADDALVIFEPEGNFFLIPTGHRKKISETPRPQLPVPPSPPKGTWKRLEPYMGALARLHGITHESMNEAVTNLLRPPTLPSPPDPNRFYFKEGRAGKISKGFSFTCQQWRHAHESEDFGMTILSPLQSGTQTGLLKVAVHAANLTTPATRHVPLRFTVEIGSCLSYAEQMLSALG